MKIPTRRLPRWLILVGLLVAASPLAMQLAAQGRGGGAPPRPLFNQPTDPLLQGFRWRSIGPVGQGARIDDYAVDEKNPSTFYVGYAVSGLWKTVNNGTTFEPIFQTYGVASIGDLALAPSDPNILYVGTGEANNRQTTTFGNGLYKSTDAGKSFQLIGLADSQSIARIVVHPKDPSIVWVAVAGHLFGPSEERGIYMTIDGGKTWNKTLYVDADTGGTDLMIDPANPQVLWAAMSPAPAHAVWLRRRRPGQRPLSVDRWRQDLEEAERQRTAARHAGTHRDGHLAVQSECALPPDGSRAG